MLPYILVSSLVLCAPIEPAPESYRAGFESIGEPELRSWLEFLASPELGGRGTGTPGYDVASRYVASVLAGLGVEPGGVDGTYFQPFALVRRERPRDEAWVRVRAADDMTAEPRGIRLRGNFDVDAPGTIAWRGPLVFVGHGDGAARDGRDTFHAVSREDGIALILPRPGDDDPTRGARNAGVRRLLIVSDRRARRPRGLRFRTLPGYRIPAPQADPDGVEIVWIAPSIADQLLESNGTDVDALLKASKAGDDPAPFALEDVVVEVAVPFTRTEQRSRNVVGIVRGSDPKLAAEAIVVGAHLDHVGTRGDQIFFGADDNASGSVAVLGVAKALMTNGRRPRRTTILMWFGAEEVGLHGSRCWTDQPLWPLDRTVAMLNMDMIGRNEERPDRDNRPGEKAADNQLSLHVVGTQRLSAELDPWVHRVNRATGLEFEYDQEGVWRRSDQYHFAAKGIPVAFFFAGFHPDYHKTTDTPDRINWDKVTRTTRLAYGLTFEIGDRPARLAIDRRRL